MIVYSATKAEFREDVRENRIETAIIAAYRRNLGHSTGAAEIASWKNSMLYMSNILDDDDIPADSGVAIEYRIPQTSKRVDFILTGRDAGNGGAAVIVELKQWSEAELTEMDGIVRTFVGGAHREVSHPSYQAWTYAALLRDFNENVQRGNVQLRPCAYLHNMESGSVIRAARYSDHLDKAPAFVRADAARLTAFIKQFIRHGDVDLLCCDRQILHERPSPSHIGETLIEVSGNLVLQLPTDRYRPIARPGVKFQLATIKLSALRPQNS